MNQNGRSRGHYIFRFHMDADWILSLFKLPEGYSVRSVLYSEDRAAFCLIVDTPEEPRFWVPVGEMIPELNVLMTTKNDSLTGQSIHISMPGLEEEVGAPNT